jgi:hypothetical protein
MLSARLTAYIGKLEIAIKAGNRITTYVITRPAIESCSELKSIQFIVTIFSTWLQAKGTKTPIAMKIKVELKTAATIIKGTLLFLLPTYSVIFGIVE